MKKAVMSEPKRIEFRGVPVPVPKEREILVKIMRIGVSGSDIHVYYGQHPYTKYPVVQGYQVSETVERVGKGSRRVKPGAS